MEIISKKMLQMSFEVLINIGVDIASHGPSKVVGVGGPEKELRDPQYS